MQPKIMRRFYSYFILLTLSGLSVLWTSAAEYKLLNGDVLRGEAASYNDDGLIVRQEVGGFTPRVPWGKFTQESLKELSQIPQAKRFVDPFVEIPKEVKQQERAKKKEVRLKEVPRVERPAPKPAFFASLANPVGLAILLILFLANLYAAYEVALFRNRPVGLVCAVSALAPIVGPLIFLAIPAQPEGSGGSEPAAVPGTAPAAAETGKVAAAAASGLGLASHDKPKGPGGPAQGEVFKRGDTTFNRRFFETKFAGFFRVVPAESEKDLVLVVKAAKAEYVAKRISRITMNEMHMQLLRGGAEAMVPFAEIIQVEVKHKDAKV